MAQIPRNQPVPKKSNVEIWKSLKIQLAPSAPRKIFEIPSDTSPEKTGFVQWTKGILTHLGNRLYGRKIPSITNAEDPGQIEMALIYILEQEHYSGKKLENVGAQKILEAYLSKLDPQRIYFTQEDVHWFLNRYSLNFIDSIRKGDLAPQREIYRVYKQRKMERVTHNRLVQPHSFTSQETFALNREKSPWPADEATAHQIFNFWIQAQILEERLQGIGLDSSEKLISRPLEKILREFELEKDSDGLLRFFSAICQSYDVRSDYVPPQKKEKLTSSMKLSLVGVGIRCFDGPDGYTYVTQIIPGGPADKEGQLKVGDRIIAVAQGNGPFEDIVHMNSDQVSERIGGKKGSLVRLLVTPQDSTGESQHKSIELKRDEIKLKDHQAKALVIDLEKSDGTIGHRIGWLMLPTFYASMNIHAIDSETSITQDVVCLLKRLQQEKIEGLIIDLRGNLGGVAQEAVNLMGLFIPMGPVIQLKDNTGKTFVVHCREASNMYQGPLVVLVNHLSASASEIFAGALQDYRRAVIVGDSRTFGKGTSQKIVDIGAFHNKEKQDAGSLKLTNLKFYRITGPSTQVRGVESHIILPSLFDHPQIGEGSLLNSLSFDQLPPVTFRPFSGHLYLDQLRTQSEKRTSLDPDFTYLRKESQLIRKILDENLLSLNEKERQTQLQESQSRQLRFEKECITRNINLPIKEYKITMDTLKQPLEPVQYSLNLNHPGTPHPGLDPVKTEALRITQNLIDLEMDRIANSKKPKPFLNRILNKIRPAFESVISR